jgi:hypothetical protein
VLVAGLPLAGCGRETRHDVRQAVEQLGSIAAEGSLMAEDVARDRTKITYVRVHGEELSSQTEHEVEKLNDAPVDPDLHDDVDKAIKLASDIGGAIDDMRVSPQDREQARTGADDLRKYADEAKKLVDSIQAGRS